MILKQYKFLIKALLNTGLLNCGNKLYLHNFYFCYIKLCTLKFFIFTFLLMPYLIDANNLAGRLKILNNSGFDQELITLAKSYFVPKNKKAILVFDSSDPLGDRYTEDNITVIYTPRDAIYDNADDKIIELMKGEKKPEDWIVVSDDMRIIDEAQRYDVEVMLARDFARELLPAADVDDEEDEGLDSDTVNYINSELMDEWN